MNRIIKSIRLRLFLCAVCFPVLLLPLTGFSQIKQIEIVHAGLMEHDETLGPGAIKCLGDVRFSQEEMIMDCDSAYYYSVENLVYAYSRIHISQGDTLHLYGDMLEYSGNEKMARVRKNVMLVDKETTLQTDYLDFDRKNDVGFYFNGGTISSGDNILRSNTGYYYSAHKMAHFRDSVVITNPDYIITSDTLKYHTETEIAYFEGPTEIISDENYIYCENGWYDTERNISQFNKNACLRSNDQFLSGDSLYYERENGLGKAFDNVSLFDSTQHILFRGKEAFYTEEPEYAMLTDSAEFVQISEGDSLFVHADTLESVLDSSGVYKILKAYYRVKIFRTDIQGKCDSLVYLEKDSVFHLYYEPVLWSEQNQLTSDLISVHLANRRLDYVEFHNASFITSRDDSIRFNQIRGRNMTGYFYNNQLVRILVKGNGQAIYFIRDELELIGVNKVESTDMIIYLKDNRIDRINMLVEPAGTIYPPEYLQKEELFLKGYIWLEKYRPFRKEDIFRWEN
jgi:lipopolysaccharide export system protein LptA